LLPEGFFCQKIFDGELNNSNPEITFTVSANYLAEKIFHRSTDFSTSKVLTLSGNYRENTGRLWGKSSINSTCRLGLTIIAKHKVGSSTLLTRSRLKPLGNQGLFLSLITAE
jgi:hypothetical protein